MRSSDRWLAYEFANNVKDHIDVQDFQDSRNPERSKARVVLDNMRGKLAEIFVFNLLKAEPFRGDAMNFDVYEEGKGDDYDIRYKGKIVDVKASSSRASCLMVTAKMMATWEASRPPDWLCLVFVEGIDDIEDSSKVDVSYGFGISFEAFKAKAELIDRGECIPFTCTRLKADNYIYILDGMMAKNESNMIEFLNA